MKLLHKIKLSQILVGIIFFSLLTSGTLAITIAPTEMQDSIQVNIPVPPYAITQKNNYDYISLENYGRLLIPGKPNLPSKIFTIAIPHEARITDVTINSGQLVELQGSYQIEPTPLPQLIGEHSAEFYQQEQHNYQQNYHQTYLQNENYPENIGEYLGTAGYRELQLVEIRITPLRYNPQTDTLQYCPDIQIDIDYSIPLTINQETPVSEATLQHAKDIILNYNQAATWYPQTTQRGTDYVIITLDSLVGAVAPLRNWEQSKGQTVQIVTTSTINTQYSGYDLEEKIRNFLRDKYPTSSWGVHNVLFVGDYDDVPMRRTAQDIGYGAPETDFYYAELSLPDAQSWDADGDHNYGENSDPIDYYGEINVGRIPWSDPQTVQHICEKSVAYEQNNDPSFKKNILLLGAFFWDNDPNPKTDNAVLMEAKVDQAWMTDWSMTRMYETGYTTYPHDYDLTRTNVVSVWSAGKYAFVNWAGHGSPTGCYRYHPSQAFILSDDCPSLNDDFPAIIFADACSNSDTDHLNIGKAMLKQGGVGFVGATKVALGCPGWDGPEDGSSQSLDYLFTTKVTSAQYSQGEALQSALTEMYVNGLWSYMKYETFEWAALWGNPNLGMGQTTQNTPPNNPNTPTGPSQGIVGTVHEFIGQSTDPDGDDIYYKWDWGDGSYCDWQGPYPSGTMVTCNHTWFSGGSFEVKVKAKDVAGAMSEWSEPKIFTVGAPSLEIVGPASGFSPIQFTLSNTGQADAHEVRWTLTVMGGIFSMVTSQEQGTFDSLLVDDQVNIVTTETLFGLGPLSITIDVSANYTSSNTKHLNGFIIGPFILILG
jgi:hypothetical protein